MEMSNWLQPTLLVSVLALAYRLGYYSRRIESLAERQLSLDTTIGRIFGRLDELAASLPHRCLQLERLEASERQIAVNSNRLEHLERQGESAD